MISYGRQTLDKKDIAAVVRVLGSDWLTQGPEVGRFEEAFAAYCGARYAVAVSSGTAGLHLACLVAGFDSGSEVITSPLTFVATPNSVLYAGASPKLADIDEKTLGLDPEKIIHRLTPKVRGVMPVYYAGQPSVWAARKPRVTVIADACHALGAEVHVGGRWKRVGGEGLADMTVFSFHPVKQMTTGEGGMVVTDNPRFYEALKRLRSHGIERSRDRFIDKNQSQNPWYYEMTSLGFNYRLSDIQCALGLSQLKKINGFLEKRRSIAAFYDRIFKEVPNLQIPQKIEGTRSSHHLYVLRINFKAIGQTRRRLMETLKKKGVGTQVHYIPVYRQPYYRTKNVGREKDFPVCEKFYEEALTIPLHAAMTGGDRQKVAREVLAFFRSGR